MRRTAKFVVAEGAARLLSLEGWDTAEELYKLLQEKGYMWDSKTGRWIYLPEIEADTPSPLIRVRVWAELQRVQKIAGKIAVKLSKETGYELVDSSEVYPCRPPKQKEGRIYLTFK